MQAIVFRTGQVSRTLLVALVLLAGLMIGAVGGYFINDLSRTVSGTSTATLSQAGAANSDVAGSFARHAATERAEADSAIASNFALSMARHAATERAEADASVPSIP